MDIKLTFEGNEELWRSLVGRGEQILPALQAKMTYLMQRLAQKIVAEKLSGQVVQRKSGTLANSIMGLPATIEGEQVRGQLDWATGPAWYGKVLNFGGKKAAYMIFPVNKKVLRFMWEKPGYRDNPEGYIYAMNVMRLALKPRNFIEESVKEMQEEIARELITTVVRIATQ